MLSWQGEALVMLVMVRADCAEGGGVLHRQGGVRATARVAGHGFSCSKWLQAGLEGFCSWAKKPSCGLLQLRRG